MIRTAWLAVAVILGVGGCTQGSTATLAQWEHGRFSECDVGALPVPSAISQRPVVPRHISAIHVCIWRSDIAWHTSVAKKIGDWWVGPFSMRAYANALKQIKLNSPYFPFKAHPVRQIKASPRTTFAELYIFSKTGNRRLMVTLSGGLSYDGGSWQQYAKFSGRTYGVVPPRLAQILQARLQ